MEDYRSKLRSSKKKANEQKESRKSTDDEEEQIKKDTIEVDNDFQSLNCSKQKEIVSEKPKAQFRQTNLELYFPPSPYGKSQQQTYGDRFIPSRDRDIVRDFQLMEPSFSRISNNMNVTLTPSKNTKPTSRADAFFRTELFDDLSAADEYIFPDSPSRTPRRVFHYTSTRPNHCSNTTDNNFTSRLFPSTTSIPTSPTLSASTISSNRTQLTSNRIKIRSRSSSTSNNDFSQVETSLTHDISPVPALTNNSRHSRAAFIDSPNSALFQTIPISEAGRRILSVPDRYTRPISSTPIKILDAPDLKDDFYLNLIDWGKNDLLAVGLESCVYLWNANTSRVTKLCDFVSDTVATVKWSPVGSLLAIGTENGKIVLYNTDTLRKVRIWRTHNSRVGSLTWKSNILTSGGRDRIIYHHDVRSSSSYFRQLVSHTHEICGLQWNPEGTMLASGGNDNDVLIWESHNDNILQRFSEHKAAVKALCWSPHKRGILASGGGSMDKTIKFWNVNSGELTASHDTGSQVCNLIWSKRSDELVSSHGYSSTETGLSNQVIVWKADKKLPKLATLTGHTSRVLYMSLSHDGSTIVTGAGDQTLRFWDIFSSVESIRTIAPKDRQACLR